MRTLLMVFVKYPEPGRVKTRLAAETSVEAAATIYRTMVRAVAGGIPGGQAVRVLYDPFRSEAEYRAWLEPDFPGAEYCPQAAGDLGARLLGAFAGAFADGWKAVAVIGSDCVELTLAIYASVWEKVAAHHVVIGPTHDGGYYLLALDRMVPELFAGIAWSTEAVFAQTLAAAENADLHPAILPCLNDLDTLADWEKSGIGEVG